jgi:HEXXH motif-containing protein
MSFDSGTLQHVLGAPEAEVTETLMRASARQALGHLNMVREVVELADGLQEHAVALTSLCYDIAMRGPETDERLRAPAFRAWLTGFSGIEAWSADNPALMSQLALIDNMRFSPFADGDWEGAFAVIDGVCAGWDCRMALGGLPNGNVRLEKSGAHIAARADGGGRFAFDLDDRGDARVLRAVALPDSNIVLRNDLPLFKVNVRAQMIYTRQAVEYGDYDTRESSYGPFDSEPFLEAAAMLRDVWPEEYEDWKKTLRIVVPRNVPPGWKMGGFTVGSYQGACWIGARAFPELLDALVHEQSHVKLRYVQDTCPILEDTQPDKKFVVGWRKDPRPLVGLYEGVYVHLHVAETMRRIVERGAVDAKGMELCRSRLDELLTHAVEARDVLARHAKFTPEGKAFLAWASEAADDHSRFAASSH